MLTTVGIGLAIISIGKTMILIAITIIVCSGAVIIGPIQSIKKKPMSGQRKKQNKIKAGVTAAGLLVGSILLNHPLITAGICSGLIVEAVQIILIYSINLLGRKNQC
jgi:hypothetical protein